VINDDDDDGERAKKIETGLALAILKARIDSEPEWRSGFTHRFIDAPNLADSSSEVRDDVCGSTSIFHRVLC